MLVAHPLRGSRHRHERAALGDGALERSASGASIMNIQDRFFDVLPFKRKSAADWILPAVTGLSVGIAVGVGLGLLYAPSTGEEARVRLREGASRMKERAAGLAGKARAQLPSTERMHSHVGDS
jgi:YtxH-like protein